MEVSDDELSDRGSDIELDNRMNELLNQDPDDYNAYLPLDRFDFGPGDYCSNFKEALATESKRRTSQDSFPRQLEVALGSHLGRDGLLLAGTGSGKTLAMIVLSFLDKKHRVFMISPLNALANGQVKQFEAGLKAVAVNTTTKYKDLYKEISDYHIVYRTVLDPTRLLPIVKSPLAALGPQIIIIDETHCIIKWRPHFRPQYANIGTLKLLLTGESPFIAATATETATKTDNRLMQEAIENSYRGVQFDI